MGIFAHLRRAALCVLLVLPAATAAAQDPFAPAVVVNDQLVTEFDIAQRQRLMGLMGVPNTRESAIETLIDDRLRAQAAKALGVTMTEERLQASVEEFASARRMTGEQMFARAAQAGVTRQGVLDLIENQAAFRDAMRQRFLSQATPTDAELEGAAEIGIPTGRMSVRLAELVIPLQERGESQTRSLAADLSGRFEGGEDFTEAVRRYSRAASARRGGETNWIPLDRLPAQIGTEIALLQPGQVTRPIDVPGAVVFLKLLETRQDAPGAAAGAAPGGASGTAATASASGVSVTIGRLVIPLSRTASETAVADAEAEATRTRAALDSCTAVDARAESFGPGSGIVGPVSLDSLPEAERDLVARLEDGEAGGPVRTTDGLVLIVLCARSSEPAATTAETSPDALEALRARLVNERMVGYAEGYLQELRRDAVIEYR